MPFTYYGFTVWLFSKKKSSTYFSWQRVQSANNNSRKRKKKTETSSRSVLFFSIWITIVSLLIASIWRLRLTIFWDHQYISRVTFSSQTWQTLAADEAYNDVVDVFSGSHHQRVTRFPHDDLSFIQSKYPFIAWWNIVFTSVQEIEIDFLFYEPDFRLKKNEELRAWYVQGPLILPLASGNILWQENFLIELPQYTYDSTWVMWVFHDINPSLLLSDYASMRTIIQNIRRYVFLPWWKKSILITEWWQQIFISHSKSIQEQIQAYLLAEERIKDSYKIDLASLEHIIAE